MLFVSYFLRNKNATSVKAIDDLDQCGTLQCRKNNQLFEKEVPSHLD